MNYQSVLEYCIKKPCAIEDYALDPESTVVKVGSKMFAILNIKGGKVYISLKCDPFTAETLRQQYPAVKPAYHLDEPNWNIVALDGTVPASEVCWMIDHSYALLSM